MTAVELVGINLLEVGDVRIQNSGIGRLSSVLDSGGTGRQLAPGESPPPSDLGAPYRRKEAPIWLAGIGNLVPPQEIAELVG